MRLLFDNSWEVDNLARCCVRFDTYVGSDWVAALYHTGRFLLSRRTVFVSSFQPARINVTLHRNFNFSVNGRILPPQKPWMGMQMWREQWTTSTSKKITTTGQPGYRGIKSTLGEVICTAKASGPKSEPWGSLATLRTAVRASRIEFYSKNPIYIRCNVKIVCFQQLWGFRVFLDFCEKNPQIITNRFSGPDEKT